MMSISMYGAPYGKRHWSGIEKVFTGTLLNLPATSDTLNGRRYESVS